jgi:hypothetical protein
LGFLWSIPVIVSLFLFAYLTHPSKFERFTMTTKARARNSVVGWLWNGYGSSIAMGYSAVTSVVAIAAMLLFLSRTKA